SLGFQPLRNHRQRSKPDTGRVEDGVSHRWGQRDDGTFARARRRQIFAVEQDGFELRDVAEAGHAVLRKTRVEDLAVRELAGFKHRAADALNDGSFDLMFQAVGVDDGAAFKGRHDAYEAHFAARAVHGDLGATGDVSTFFRPARDAI